MPRLKDRILRSAWELFEERGFDNVSLRAIAEHAGTTIGNLTYHYPQKEDLLVAMQLSSSEVQLSRFERQQDTPEAALADLWRLADTTEAVALEKSFYFGSILKLCADYPALRELVAATRERARDLYRARFRLLRASGHMRGDLPECVYESLIRAILMCVFSWIDVRKTVGGAEDIPSISRILKDLFLLCLTEKGLDLLASLETREE